MEEALYDITSMRQFAESAGMIQASRPTPMPSLESSDCTQLTSDVAPYADQ